MSVIFLFLLSFLSATFLTSKIRDFALREKIQDLPTERGLHSKPTPRGGGLAIVLATLFLTPLCFYFTIYSWPLYGWACLLSAGAIAWMGWVDDRRSLSFKFRLFVQMLLAAFVCILLFREQPLLLIFFFFFLVWITNAFNFMDGIDGIAGMQALFFSIALCLLCFFNNKLEMMPPPLVVAGAAAGFLVFNWQPAKIFMGDVGSTFLGFYLGSLGILAFKFGLLSLPSLLILWAAFLGDATYTLTCRLLSGAKVYIPHRDHAYQHAVLKGYSHQRVVLVEAGINFFWLLPLTFLSQRVISFSWAIVALAYLPIIISASFLQAGKKGAYGS